LPGFLPSQSASVSKTADNEHPLPPLRQVEVASVKHSVGPPVPEFAQRSEDGIKVASFVHFPDSTVPESVGVSSTTHLHRVRRALDGAPGVEKAGDILDENPTGAHLIKDSMELPPQSASSSSQSSTLSSHGKVLAGESSDHKVNWLKVRPPDLANVLVLADATETLPRHTPTVGVDLHGPT
jgi:hypothetical protein